MNAALPRSLGAPRFPLERDSASDSIGFGRSGRLAHARQEEEATQSWLVDLTALAQCRALLSRQNLSETRGAELRPASHPTMMDVPAAYDQFCHAHFASVKRLRPELSWDDACPAYAIALSAHALLCEGLDGEREALLESNWEHIRGQSNLSWLQARSLIADGCSALTRLDPLAMHR